MIAVLCIAVFAIMGPLVMLYVISAEQERKRPEPEPTRAYWLDTAYVGMKEMLGREPTVAEVWEATPPEWSDQ